MIRYHLPDGLELVRATEGASGYDLMASEPATIGPGEIGKVSTGLVLEMPRGIEAQIRPRSGLSSRGIVAILGTIDADYRGPCGVLLHNTNPWPYVVNVGDRVAQLVFVPIAMLVVERVARTDELSPTARGVGGFGSTGR